MVRTSIYDVLYHQNNISGRTFTFCVSPCEYRSNIPVYLAVYDSDLHYL